MSKEPFLDLIPKFRDSASPADLVDFRLGLGLAAFNAAAVGGSLRLAQEGVYPEASIGGGVLFGIFCTGAVALTIKNMRCTIQNKENSERLERLGVERDNLAAERVELEKSFGND